MSEIKKITFEEQKVTTLNKEQPKKYLCECIDCIGEWTGIYKDQKELEQDILLYCRTGKANCTVIN